MTEVERKLLVKLRIMYLLQISLFLLDQNIVHLILKRKEDNECIYDPGCHFIVKRCRKGSYIFRAYV